MKYVETRKFEVTKYEWSKLGKISESVNFEMDLGGYGLES